MPHAARNPSGDATFLQWAVDARPLLDGLRALGCFFLALSLPRFTHPTGCAQRPTVGWVKRARLGASELPHAARNPSGGAVFLQWAVDARPLLDGLRALAVSFLP
ncbi:hypothetical protein [Achromobacter spanius]|uniref:Uncharacterized protein n=1 Tax=Achromobacter spanius TaxID=217203 RepID=A0AA42LQB5_9BURK|nr:hypothetical protein [Achromobacter spanius]MDH0737539.1 hypothetical protein [Achromobacter spanius]